MRTDFLNWVFLRQKFSGYAEFIDLYGFLQPHSYHKSVIDREGRASTATTRNCQQKKEYRLKLWGEVNRAQLSQIKVIEREGWTENHRKFEGNKTPEDTHTKPRLVLHSKSHSFLFSFSRHSAAALTDCILLHVLSYTTGILDFRLFFLHEYSISLSICVSKQRKALCTKSDNENLGSCTIKQLHSNKYEAFDRTDTAD